MSSLENPYAALPGDRRVTVECRRCGVPFDRKLYEIKLSKFKCPPCRVTLQTAHEAKQKAIGRKQIKKPHSDEHREYMRAYAPVYYTKNQKRIAAEAAARRARSKPAEVARRIMAHAIFMGRLVRGPCEVCGVQKTDGHHEDYSKPLDVRWLCRRHHLERHGQIRRDAVKEREHERIESAQLTKHLSAAE